MKDQQTLTAVFSDGIDVGPVGNGESALDALSGLEGEEVTDGR